jgi:FkbM family methyltransferase
MIFSYQFLLNKYNISPKGVIHIGAHYAEESTIYARCGTERVLWIEGNPSLLPIIQDNISIYSQNNVFQALLSDTDDDEIIFNITNASMSSSILELGTHKEMYPDIKVEKELVLYSSRIDTFVKKNKIIINEYDFVNIDIQGAELLALKGFGDLLDNINYIYTEVNIDNVYEGCPLLDEMDEFLTLKGFQRVELSLKYKSWGDAFYIRKNTTKSNLQKTVLESKSLIKKFKENKNSINTEVKPSLFYRVIRKIYRKFFKRRTNNNYSLINTSGENEFAFKLIKQYSKEEKLVIFDIGANEGEYSEMIIKHCTKLNIKYQLHLFEPQNECVEVLLSKFNTNPNVIINNVAVSNENGCIDFYMETKGASSSSIYKREVFVKSEKVQVNTIKLDDYIVKHNIDKINFIKIDVEGHELEVLKSSQNNFDKIENIQFEYGGTYLDSKCTLKDVYVLLREYFHIGKINSNGVYFTPYIIELEDYEYSNYIAENKKLKWSRVDYSNISHN